MIEKKLLDLLICPENQTPLVLADESLLSRLNLEIAAGRLKNRSGHCLEEPLDGGLVREDGQLLYPIVEGIPVMLIDEAIAVPPEGEDVSA